MTRKSRHRREVSKQAAALAAAIQVLHSRIEKLEKMSRHRKQVRRIGFELEGVIDGSMLHQDPDD